jgi:hypothetical protein
MSSQMQTQRGKSGPLALGDGEVEVMTHREYHESRAFPAAAQRDGATKGDSFRVTARESHGHVRLVSSRASVALPAL